MNGAELERTLFHWPAVIDRAPDGWAKGFAKNIDKSSRKRGWRPTQRQAQVMRNMVSDLFIGSDVKEFIE